MGCHAPDHRLSTWRPRSAHRAGGEEETTYARYASDRLKSAVRVRTDATQLFEMLHVEVLKFGAQQLSVETGENTERVAIQTGRGCVKTLL